MSLAAQSDVPQEPVMLSVVDGYSRWAKFYDTKWNTLIAAEELYSLPILESLVGETALDVGAGTGRFSLKLARNGWKVTALDPNSQMLSFAKRAAGDEGLSIQFIHSPIEGGLSTPSTSFDLVVCALTLCHIPDLRGSVNEFHRAMAPGGHLLITDVHPDFISAGFPTQFVEDEVTYHLPNEPHTRDNYLQAIADTASTFPKYWISPAKKLPEDSSTHSCERISVT